MEEGKVVRIVEVCKICPSAHPSSESQFSLPLASFDWICLRVPLLQRLLFYPLPQTHDSFTDSIVPKLKRALSLALTHFLPLAGNLVWPEDSPLPFFLYSPNDGVSFTLADTDSDFHHVSGCHPRQINDCLPFIPTIQSSDSCAPLLAIQVTHFPNHGFSIGFAAHHVIFDGQSFTLFVKAWAHISKLMANQLMELESNEFCPLPPELTPSFERPPNVLHNPFDYVPKSRSVKCATEILPTSNYLMASFQLTPTHIQKLKKRVLEDVDPEEEKELHLSTFVVAYAYALTCFIKSKGEECKELVNFDFAANIRGVLDPPVSSTYFGNCLTNRGAMMEAREFREQSGLPKIAKKISNLILELRRTRMVKVSSMADYIQFQTKYLSKAELCWVASSPKFKLYQTDFGWGNPNKVEMVLLGRNMMYLIDTKDGAVGGVEIGLLFPDHHQCHIFASHFAQGLN